MNKYREQLCPLWLAILIGLGVIASLAAVYQSDGEQSNVLSQQEPSELSVAYLEARLRVQPKSVETWVVLGEQYLKLQRWDQALTVADQLTNLGADQSKMRQQAMLLRIETVEQKIYSLNLDDPLRMQSIKELSALLSQADTYDWPIDTLNLLSEKALLAGVEDRAVEIYQKLAVLDTQNATYWYEQIAFNVLAHQDYTQAAAAYFSAAEITKNVQDKRSYFIKGLEVLKSGNQLELACKEGERYLGDLNTDREALAYLIRLARQANRPDLVHRYATALSKLLQVSHKRATGHPLARLVSTAPVSSTKADEFDLVFQAFIEGGELSKAEEIATRALELNLDPVVWTHRLAQVNQWLNQPQKSFDYWYQLAKITNDNESWLQVLNLAPQFESDGAYLMAWQQLKPNENLATAKNALLERYVQLTHWESALRINHQLQEHSAGQEKQKLLLLETAISEQLTYHYPLEHPQRASQLQRFTELLRQGQNYTWDIEQTKWLANKSEETGAYEQSVHYYKQLANLDQTNQADWQTKLADIALARQDYETAAHAYFSAQQLSTELDEQRVHFLSALKVLVASGQIDKACDEAEQRAGVLTKDPETLRYLINLARQANRADLMTLYARQLIESSLQGQNQHFYSDFENNNSIQRKQFAFGARSYFVNSTNKTVNGSDLHGTEEDFELVFQALIESKQLAEAQKIAEAALERQFDSLIWTQRLAQISDWSGSPNQALRYWWTYAQKSNDPQAWERVRQLAPQLNNERAYLAASLHAAQQAPYDINLHKQVVALYEKLGQPEQGMIYLKQRARGANFEPLLNLYAQLAERSGYGPEALSAYKELLKANPTTISYATNTARFQYKADDIDSALQTMRDNQKHVAQQVDAAEFWRFYAELASFNQNNTEAHTAYDKLLATSQANADDLNRMSYFYHSYPLDAARIAEQQYNQDGSVQALRLAISYYAEANAWSQVQQLLFALTPEQQRNFERSALFLSSRAQYHIHQQNWSAALTDLRMAVNKADVNDDVRILYLWLLVEFGAIDELKMVLANWRSLVKTNDGYLGPFAAAELRIGNAKRAAVYLRQQSTLLHNDPLWLIALAEAEEQAGHPDIARQLRQKSWRILQAHVANNELSSSVKTRTHINSDQALSRFNAAERQDLQRSFVTLSPLFLNADSSRQLLLSLMHQDAYSAQELAMVSSLLGDNPGIDSLSTVLDPDESQASRTGQLSTATKEVALGWALSTESHELARAWLARVYIHQRLRPAYAEMVLALESKDKATLQHLLDESTAQVSIDDKIAALIELGRGPEAETLVFEAAAGAPDNSDKHQALVELLRPDRPQVGVDVSQYRSSPLRYTETQAVAGIKLTNQLGIRVENTLRAQSTTDQEQLAWVPKRDNELRLQVFKRSLDHDLSLTLGYRNALETFYSAQVDAKLNRRGPWTINLAAGVNQYTTLTPVMRVAATKDLLKAELLWAPESRWFAQFLVEANRFHAQDRTYLGRGFEFNQELGYHLRSDYPDLSIRLIGAQGRYSASDNTVSLSRRILPNSVNATAQEMMPQNNFQQYGLMFSVGASEADSYTRAWRPFVDAGYVHDSNQGWGPRALIGVGGSVLGNDHLRIFYLHESAGRGDSQRTNQFGLSYRLAF